MAYAQIEPFGMQVQNLQIGRLMSLVANLFAGGKNKPAFTPADFTIGLEPQPQQKLAESLKQAFGSNLVVRSKKQIKRKPGKKRPNRRRKNNVST